MKLAIMHYSFVVEYSRALRYRRTRGEKRRAYIQDIAMGVR
jgi:hypothetical protein